MATVTNKTKITNLKSPQKMNYCFAFSCYAEIFENVVLSNNDNRKTNLFGRRIHCKLTLTVMFSV